MFSCCCCSMGTTYSRSHNGWLPNIGLCCDQGKEGQMDVRCDKYVIPQNILKNFPVSSFTQRTSLRVTIYVISRY